MLKNFKQKTIGKIAERMVVEIEDPPAIAEKIMDYSKAKLAFITTAGVHLRSQDPFNVKGDPSFRLIPGDVDLENLTITHDHYDKRGALEDINLVFPLEVLRDLESEGIIGQLSQRHIGLMGYIPQFKKFMKTSLIEIGDILEEDGVDIALLSPG